MSSKLSRDEWVARAEGLDFRNQAFINGRYVPAASGKTFLCTSPINGQVLAEVAACDAEDVDRAVKAARQAFESGVWSNLPPKRRKRVLLKFASLIESHADELALLETLDMGKPIS
ncbi:MAG TPA: aldehyde dehydrogenase family protein, partial [Sphingomonadales bacterium]